MDERHYSDLTIEADSKIVYLIMDGLGGFRSAERGSELMESRHPALNQLARESACGLMDPVAPGVTPASGPGHLALFGYDPEVFELGRGALSAAGLEFPLGPGDVAARGNLCTLDSAGHITDRRAGRLPDPEARAVVQLLSDKVHLDGADVIFRHEREHRVLVVLRSEGLDPRITDTDPQAVGVAPLPPRALDPAAERTVALVAELDAQVRACLSDQPKANGLLLRGFDQHRELPGFLGRYGLRAAAVAVYPMYRGIAKLGGMDVLGRATGLDEQLAILGDACDGYDFFFVHHK